LTFDKATDKNKSAPFYGPRCTCLTGRGTFGVSGRLKSIVKHRILGSSTRVSCAKNVWTDLNHYGS